MSSFTITRKSVASFAMVRIIERIKTTFGRLCQTRTSCPTSWSSCPAWFGPRAFRAFYSSLFIFSRPKQTFYVYFGHRNVSEKFSYIMPPASSQPISQSNTKTYSTQAQGGRWEFFVRL